MWFSTKFRITATFGMVKTSLPPAFSVHGAMNSPSVLPARLPRPLLRLASNMASTASRVAGRW